MSDTSAIGIEAVECLPDAAGVTVRVSGRWRRRRPDWVGPAMLVIEAEGRRVRIPSMPEPPYLTGALPGMWRMSFSVPAELAPHLEAGAWLALGAVMAPIALPPGTTARSEAAAPAPARPPGISVPLDPDVLAERAALNVELAAASARRRAEEAEARIDALRAELAALTRALEVARAEPARLQAELEARVRELRVARQEREAERHEREAAREQAAELEQRLARAREHARAAEDRRAELERELRRAHREADEARQEAAAARAVAARPPAPPPSAPMAELAPEPVAVAAPPPGPRFGPLQAEFDLAERSRRGGARPASTPQLPSNPGLLEAERALVSRLGPRAPKAPVPEAPVPEAPAPAAPDPAPAELAAELDLARAALAGARRERAEALERVAALEDEVERQRERSARALHAIADFRRELGQLRTPPPAPEDPPPALQPDRLNAALERLRERQAPLPEPPPADPPPAAAPEASAAAPEPPADAAEPSELAPALPPVPAGPAPAHLPALFRELAGSDPGAAGRLVVCLLPAQPLVYPRPIAYDIVLGRGFCVQVTSDADQARVLLRAAPRSLEETQLRIEGGAAALAQLLAAGPLRRRLRRHRARVQGERGALRALDALVGTPLWPAGLLAAGVRLDAGLALRLAGAFLAATAPSEPIAIAHLTPGTSTPTAVMVRDAGRTTVSELTIAPPDAALVTCPSQDLLAVLLGRRGPGVVVAGDERPLGLAARALQGG